MYMTTIDYKRTLKAMRREKAELLAKKNEIEIRVSTLNQSIYTISKLCGEPTEGMEKETGGVGTGVTGIVRTVLRSAKEPLGSLDIKNTLNEMGFPVKGDNPQATIHVALKRLHRQGEIAEVKVAKPNGKATTKWSWKQVK